MELQSSAFEVAGRFALQCRCEKANPKPSYPPLPCPGHGAKAGVHLVKVVDDEGAARFQVAGDGAKGAFGRVDQRKRVRTDGTIGTDAEIPLSQVGLNERRFGCFAAGALEHVLGEVHTCNSRGAAREEPRKVQPGAAGEVEDVIPGLDSKGVQRLPPAGEEVPAGGIVDEGLGVEELAKTFGFHEPRLAFDRVRGNSLPSRMEGIMMRSPIHLKFAAIGLLALSVCGPSRAAETIATFSIVGYDPVTKEVGVAVQSKFFAVGSVVPWAKAGVGAIATQAFGNTTFGPKGLDLLATGVAPEKVVEALLKPDEGRDSRQIGIVDGEGRVASYTGPKCQAWAGGRTGKNYAAQGNILTGEEVVDAMAQAFESTPGMLGERLLRALEEGQKAGGDSRGMQSAAIYIAKDGAGYGGFNDRYCDLRVDDAKDPIAELRRIFDIWKVNALILEGYRLADAKEYEAAISTGKEAMKLDATTGEPEYHLACYLSRAGRKDEAFERLREALGKDEKLGKNAVGDPDFEPLRADPRWAGLMPK